MARAVAGAVPVRGEAPEHIGNTELEQDRALVLRVQHGEREAFNELARRYARRAFAIAYRILRQVQDAEDLVQDALIAALETIGSFDAARPFAPWFFKI